MTIGGAKEISVMVKRSRSPLAAVLALLLSVACVSPVHADAYVPGCAVPFAAISVNHPIDNECGNEGGAFGPGDPDIPEQHAQNRAKNNLCAAGTPSRVTILTMKKLQQITNQMKAAHQLKFGAPDILPDDRSVLQNIWTTSDGNTIGEGSLVLFVGFIQKTKPGGVETVNCGLSGAENDDIHIVLGGTTQAAECSSIVAEMIPHFRPTSWNHTVLNTIHKAVRVRGQLFFDASHVPCSGGASVGTTLKRLSDWEIHPVYGIDVCKNGSLAACRFDDDSVWVPLDQVP
jgi:hypothetical protein